MNTNDYGYMFLHANEIMNFMRLKYLSKPLNIIKKPTIFTNIADLLDDETLLELKYTCRKFKNKVESNPELINRANKAELKKVKGKLVKIIRMNLFRMNIVHLIYTLWELTSKIEKIE